MSRELHPEFYSKHEAAKYCRNVLGHTDHFGTGQCGDGGWGSREYFRAPDAPKNKYGVTSDKYSSISRIGRKWIITDWSSETAEVAA